MIRSLDISRERIRRVVADALCAFGQHRSFKSPQYRTSRRRGLTLVEVMFCLVIVMMASIGAVGAITYTRLNMELEKQRLAALGYCRQSMEALQSLDAAFAGTKSLVPFNAPGIEDLNANIQVEYYKINGVDDANPGTVDWNTSMTEPSLEEPVYARVSVSWVPYGSQNRPQEVSMSTIVTRGID